MAKIINSEKELPALIKHKTLKTIISIPRSNSTIIELILGLNSLQVKIIHEPFLEYGYYNAPVSSAYQKIYSNIINIDNKEEKIFLIKEMAHWLTKNRLYKHFLPCINPPIILLVKNPFLTIESKIKKLLQGAYIKNRPELNKFLSPFVNKRRDKNIQDSRKLLNLFALKRGYKNWNRLVKEEAIQKRNLTIFNPILQYFIENSSEDIWGWKSINRIKIFLDKNKIKYKILEGIDFQLAPVSTIYSLCEILDINFNKKMLNFSKKKFERLMNLNQIQPSGSFWYKEVLSNTKIVKPSLPPLSINKFPSNMQSYIQEVALPTYRQFCLDANRINVLDCDKNFRRDKTRFQNYKIKDPIYFTANEHMSYFN